MIKNANSTSTKNFMIKNKEIFVYSVGATIGRPLHLPEFHAFHTENKYQIYGLTIISAGDQWSPLQTNIH